METLINYEPGEFSGTSYPKGTANETQQQLTFEDMLSK